MKAKKTIRYDADLGDLLLEPVHNSSIRCKLDHFSRVCRPNTQYKNFNGRGIKIDNPDPELFLSSRRVPASDLVVFLRKLQAGRASTLHKECLCLFDLATTCGKRAGTNIH